jgi:cell wall-associated NlpC family hydrolase
MPGPKPPIAAQWANANYNISGWVVVSSPMPGDVASFSGHVGIVSGNGLTISATLHNGVVRNDWGFRTGRTPVFRRFVGYSQYY